MWVCEAGAFTVLKGRSLLTAAVRTKMLMILFTFSKTTAVALPKYSSDSTRS